jgi:hypothetical protein
VPALVAQAEAQPVDLGLGRIGQRRRRIEPQIPADAQVELLDLAALKGIGKRHHPHRVGDLGKALGRRGADAVAGAVGALEIGKARLDLGVARLQPS